MTEIILDKNSMMLPIPHVVARISEEDSNHLYDEKAILLKKIDTQYLPTCEQNEGINVSP